MTVACIIPVRGGSKGIPRKNLAWIHGQTTLLEWTVDQALRCFDVSEVLVSTEDAEMTNVAVERGAQVVHRPADLAEDHTTTAHVVKDLLHRLDPAAERFSQIVILQATSPLREDADIQKARSLINSGGFDSVISGFEYTEHHPAKMYFLDGNTAHPVSPEYETVRRQDLPKVYRRNGAIFWTTRKWFDSKGELWGGRTGLVLMPKHRSIDIDSPRDLDAARWALDSGPAIEK